MRITAWILTDQKLRQTKKTLYASAINPSLLCIAVLQSSPSTNRMGAIIQRDVEDILTTLPPGE
ncbi:hypothetical protein [Actinomyces oris]|uniref:Uncharacterized protein n=1 Tax=Actinomyces oris TaxID=544580 RepID=A0AAW9KY34_9ACTO|nr:hypothetical protein [Actinomyces oris]MEA1304925.1 hypothetical protein [Actinomyces oris]